MIHADTETFYLKPLSFKDYVEYKTIECDQQMKKARNFHISSEVSQTSLKAYNYVRCWLELYIRAWIDSGYFFGVLMAWFYSFPIVFLVIKSGVRMLTARRLIWEFRNRY